MTRPPKTWHFVAALAVYLALLTVLGLHIVTLLASAGTSDTQAADESTASNNNDTMVEVEDQGDKYEGCAGWPQYSNARRSSVSQTTHRQSK